MTSPPAGPSGAGVSCPAHTIDWGGCVREWPHLGVPHTGADGQSWMNVPVAEDEPPLQQWVRATDYQEASAAVLAADSLLTEGEALYEATKAERDALADRLAVALAEVERLTRLLVRLGATVEHALYRHGDDYETLHAPMREALAEVTAALTPEATR